MDPVPDAFNARLATTFGAGYVMRANETVQRYELISPSAEGRPVSQFWGWYRDPKTGTPIEPDPVTGLHPYRGLDSHAQEAIIANLQRGYIGRTGYGLKDWAHYQRQNLAHNREVMRRARQGRAQRYVDLIHEMNLSRPWLKHHSGSWRSRRVALSAS
jgi:hypothetical protein